MKILKVIAKVWLWGCLAVIVCVLGYAAYTEIMWEWAVIIGFIVITLAAIIILGDDDNDDDNQSY